MIQLKKVKSAQTARNVLNAILLPSVVPFCTHVRCLNPLFLQLGKEGIISKTLKQVFRLDVFHL